MNKLELIVFNIGHGLSVALIERPENYVTLIDLGADSGFTPLKYLALRMKLRPDLVCVTHPHADHLDDVETALVENFRPLGIFYQDYDWEDVKRREKKELAYKIDGFGNLIKKVPRKSYGGRAELQCWRYTPARAMQIFGDATYVNNSSFFFIYKWRDFKIAIAGDLESDGMNAMMSGEGFQADAKGTDILIPPHHGHKNGFPRDWVEVIGKPYVSIISVQERDTSVDSRYSSPSFARGVTFGNEKRYSLTTRFDGNIHVTMQYGSDGKPNWSFASL
jgi:beta-lactamase superfamily II metal-dependent hydrolase